MMFDITSLIKFGTFIVALIAIPKYYNEFKFLKKDKLKDDYDFAEKIINNKNYESLHDFLLEKVFFTLMSFKFQANEIRFFLKQESPMKKISDFMKTYSYIEVVKENNLLKLIYKEKYISEKKRNWLIIKNNGFYFISVVFACVPIFVMDKIIELPIYLIIPTIFYSITFFTVGVSSLNIAFNIRLSQELINYSKDIVIDVK